MRLFKGVPFSGRSLRSFRWLLRVRRSSRYFKKLLIAAVRTGRETGFFSKTICKLSAAVDRSLKINVIGSNVKLQATIEFKTPTIDDLIEQERANWSKLSAQFDEFMRSDQIAAADFAHSIGLKYSTPKRKRAEGEIIEEPKMQSDSGMHSTPSKRARTEENENIEEPKGSKQRDSGVSMHTTPGSKRSRSSFEKSEE